jgi:hypothetical protein
VTPREDGDASTARLPDAPERAEIGHMDDARAYELEALRRMTPAEKLAVMRALIRQAYTLKAAGIRATQPELSEEQVWDRVREIMGRDRP